MSKCVYGSHFKKTDVFLGLDIRSSRFSFH